MMEKLIVVVMGPGNENFLDMCKESVKDADKIFHFTSDLDRIGHKDTYFNQWDELDKQTNGKSRNYYLKFLKENYPNDWCLVLDEDEVCEDISKIKEFINQAKDGIYSVKMRHFIGDLGHEDATQKDHWVFNRLFKISESKEYPLDSHPILQGNQIGGTTCTTIWHLGHLPVEYMHYIVKRYKQHANDSTIHSQDYLSAWRDSHLYGGYARRPINPTEIPRVILDNFGIDFDELYFTPRKQMEAKHYQDAIDWKNYFKPFQVILYGCGFGQRVYALEQIGVPVVGWDISKYAVDNSLSDNIKQGDIIESSYCGKGLSVAYDLLEHIPYDKLDNAINNLIFGADDILVSIPFKGDPNLYADPTHIIKEDKDWWINKFTNKGLELVETPNHFQFRDQILIFKKGGKK